MKKYIYIGHQKITKKQVIEEIHHIILTKTFQKTGVEGLAPDTREKFYQLCEWYAIFCGETK